MNNKLDFKNKLYYLLMDHADVLDETDGQRLAGCSVDQMFDDLLRDQDSPEPMHTNNINFYKGKSDGD